MKDKKRLIIKIVIIVSIITIGIILDQVTKRVLDSLSSIRDGLVVIPNFFYLRIAHNSGVAWSLFENNFFILYIIPLVALGIFIYLISKGNFTNMKLYTIGLSLMIAGLLGNYIDRVLLKYVIDFLEFHFGNYQYPTFNVADSLLVVGVTLFSIDILFLDTARTKKLKQEAYEENINS